MLKSLCAASIALFATSAAALAAETPKDVKTCMDDVYAQAQAAQSKNLSDDKLAEIEGLLSQMEEHCMAKSFAKASNVSGQITGTMKN